MRITKLWKTSNSNTGQCPALYATDDTRLAVVQGWATETDRTVRVPVDVLDRIPGFTPDGQTIAAGDHGEYLVTGQPAPAATLGQLDDPAADETAVVIPAIDGMPRA